jgi:hypothetical protein
LLRSLSSMSPVSRFRSASIPPRARTMDISANAVSAVNHGICSHISDWHGVAGAGTRAHRCLGRSHLSVA